MDGARESASLGRMPATTPLQRVDDAHFTAEVLEAEVPVLVDFTAAWCPPCRMMEPILGAIAGERADLRIVQVDVDADPEIAARYGVLSMPTFVLFRDGREVGRTVGSRPRAFLSGMIDRALNGDAAITAP